MIPFAKEPSRRPLSLGFHERRDIGTQARLRGRVALEPDVNLDAYSFRAVIDWIEIGLGLQAPQQFMQLQDVLEPALGLPPDRKLYVKALHETPGRMATSFKIRIQEPRIATVMKAIEALDRRYPLAGGGAVFVRALEVSVDACPRSPSDEARCMLLTAMTRTFFTQRDIWSHEKDRPRFSFARGRKPTIISPTEPLAAKSRDIWWSLPTMKRPPVDATFYVGEEGSDVMWRIMDKVLDHQNRQAGTWLELEEHERRVRVEVALQGQQLMDLGVVELTDLRTFSFTQLQGDYFSFRLPTFRDTAGPPSLGTLSNRVIEASRRRIFSDVGVLGLCAYDASRKAWLKPHQNDLRDELRRRGRELERQRAGTGLTGTTIVWKKMNKTIEMALRHLQERVRAEMGRATAAGACSA